MNVQKIQERKNALLSRREITGVITFTGATPSNNEVRKQLATKLSADEKLVVIKQVLTEYGDATAEISAVVYDSEDVKKTLEPKVKEKKKKA